MFVHNRLKRQDAQQCHSNTMRGLIRKTLYLPKRFSLIFFLSFQCPFSWEIKLKLLYPLWVCDLIYRIESPKANHFLPCPNGVSMQVWSEFTNQFSKGPSFPFNIDLENWSKVIRIYRLSAKTDPAPRRPTLGNFADIVYLQEQSILHQMRDVCTL